MKGMVLVTGGAGFIGSHVVDELINNRQKVVALDDLSGSFVDNVNKDSVFVQGSILDVSLIDRLFQQYKFEYVFHLAAYAAEGLSQFIKRFNYENNLIGSINLINASINYNVKCFVFTSSIAVYGKNQLPMSEDLEPNPEDSYGIAKYAVELELKVSREMFGLDYVIFRPHNVYGEHQNIGDKYRNVIGIFMNQIMQGKPLSIFGDGTQTRAFTYIKDITPIIASSIFMPETYGEIYNIGADKEYTVNELAESVGRAMGVKPDIIYFPERSEVKHAYALHEKAKKCFNYTAKFSLEEGLRKMAQWAIEIGPRKSKEFEDIEVKKCLPEAWL
ncbi:NAD-dependent epimerase/dehydratase family protein [bacterium]|nr:NAD-dependent epimerase/dehydratase family protein [bacterium]